MIHQVLPAIAGELSEFLQSRLGIGEDQIVLGNIMNQDGTVAVEGNKLVISLINIEREGSKGPLNSFGNNRPPVHINLFILFGAVYNQANINNRDYLEALKMISGVISFFQANNSFDSHSCPGFPPELSKVLVEIENFEFRELVNLWSGFGAKYTPSVAYRIRSLDMSEDIISDEIPPIAGITI